MTNLARDDEFPRRETEPARNGPRPPRRTAVALGDYGFKPGQRVIARVTQPFEVFEKVGYYEVLIETKHGDVKAIMPSPFRHLVGETVLATFVCFDEKEKKFFVYG